VARPPGGAGAAYAHRMAGPSTPESTPVRLAAIRDQLTLLADYL
jgi:hypothetical protein